MVKFNFPFYFYFSLRMDLELFGCVPRSSFCFITTYENSNCISRQSKNEDGVNHTVLMQFFLGNIVFTR